MNRPLLSSFILVAVFLSACGGSGGGGGGTPSSSNPASGPTGGTPGTPPATTLSLQGTVATGLAVPNTVVSAKCVTGQGFATTAPDGSYRINIVGGSLPCVLEASVPAGFGTLHSLAYGSAGGSSVSVANLTLLTELVTARVLRRLPSTFFSAFDSTTAQTLITQAQVRAAQSEVMQTLVNLPTLNALADWIATPLIAATAANPTGGDAQDQLLDLVRDRFTPANFALLVQGLSSQLDLSQIPVNMTLRLNTATGIRFFPLPFPKRINGFPDMDPTTIGTEASMAFWPLVAGIDYYSGYFYTQARGLVVGDLPLSVMPIRLQSWIARESIQGRSTGYVNDNSCSLNVVESIVGPQVIVSVGGYTFAATIDGAPNLVINGSFARGDGFTAIASQRTTGVVSTTRGVEMHVQDTRMLVAPGGTPYDAGVSITIYSTYDPFSIFTERYKTEVRVTYSVPNTEPFNSAIYPIQTFQYLCVDQNITTPPTGWDGPASSAN
jgi:hypothetical protein